MGNEGGLQPASFRISPPLGAATAKNGEDLTIWPCDMGQSGLSGMAIARGFRRRNLENMFDCRLLNNMLPLNF
jgi:hypothetical protein